MVPNKATQNTVLTTKNEREREGDRKREREREVISLRTGTDPIRFHKQIMCIVETDTKSWSLDNSFRLIVIKNLFQKKVESKSKGRNASGTGRKKAQMVEVADGQDPDRVRVFDRITEAIDL